MPQAATQYNNIIIGSVPAAARPRAVCVSEHQGAGWSVSGISEKGRCVSGCREHQGRREHQDAGRDIGPSEGEGRGKGVGVKARVGSVSGASGHTLRRVSEVRQGVCRGVGAHVKARARGGCVRVSGVRQEVRRAHIGSIREGRRARERRPYCDIVIFFEKICFLGKKPYLCNASLDRFDPKIGHLF